MKRTVSSSYTNQIADIVKSQKISEPIYIRNLAKYLSEHTGLDFKKASAATATALRRIMLKDMCPDLRMWRKGVYYRTVKTPFGETGIDEACVIRDRYLAGDIGYETGYGLMYRLGLSTQLPAHRTFVTNRLKSGVKKDMNMKFIPPRTEINTTTKPYLQVLDALSFMVKTPVDVEDPYLVLSKYVREKNLDFRILLDMANRLYDAGTMRRLAVLAGKDI